MSQNAYKRETLKFGAIGNVDHGSLSVTMNDAIQSAIQDLHQRPLLEKPRKITLTIELKPVVDKNNANGNSLDEVSMAWNVKSTIPNMGSKSTKLAVNNDGTLAFMSFMPDGAPDNTIFDEAERRQIERAEKQRMGEAAMAHQEAGK